MIYSSVQWWRQGGTPLDMLEPEERQLVERAARNRNKSRPALPKRFDVAAERARLDRLERENNESIARTDAALRDETARWLSGVTAGETPTYKQQRQLAIQLDPEWARSVAIHESGHAVADYIAGRSITFLRFAWDSNNNITGGGYFGEGTRCVHALLGGVAAQRLFGIPVSDDQWRGDRVHAVTLGCTDIEAGVRRMQDKLRRYMPAISAVADALMRETELPGSKAEDIIREALRTIL